MIYKSKGDKTMRSHIKYIKRAKEVGAMETKIIPAKSIVAVEWVRLKCQFGCGCYGLGLME
jgi:predicted metal-binding protein